MLETLVAVAESSGVSRHSMPCDMMMIHSHSHSYARDMNVRRSQCCGVRSELYRRVDWRRLSDTLRRRACRECVCVWQKCLSPVARATPTTTIAFHSHMHAARRRARIIWRFSAGINSLLLLSFLVEGQRRRRRQIYCHESVECVPGFWRGSVPVLPNARAASFITRACMHAAMTACVCVRVMGACSGIEYVRTNACVRSASSLLLRLSADNESGNGVFGVGAAPHPCRTKCECAKFVIEFIASVYIQYAPEYICTWST